MKWTTEKSYGGGIITPGDTRVELQRHVVRMLLLRLRAIELLSLKNSYPLGTGRATTLITTTI